MSSLDFCIFFLGRTVTHSLTHSVDHSVLFSSIRVLKMRFSTFVSAAAFFELSIAGYVLEDDYMTDFYGNFDFFADKDPTNGMTLFILRFCSFYAHVYCIFMGWLILTIIRLCKVRRRSDSTPDQSHQHIYNLIRTMGRRFREQNTKRSPKLADSQQKNIHPRTHSARRSTHAIWLRNLASLLDARP